MLSRMVKVPAPANPAAWSSRSVDVAGQVEPTISVGIASVAERPPRRRPSCRRAAARLPGTAASTRLVGEPLAVEVHRERRPGVLADQVLSVLEAMPAAWPVVVAVAKVDEDVVVGERGGLSLRQGVEGVGAIARARLPRASFFTYQTRSKRVSVTVAVTRVAGHRCRRGCRWKVSLAPVSPAVGQEAEAAVGLRRHGANARDRAVERRRHVRAAPTDRRDGIASFSTGSLSPSRAPKVQGVVSRTCGVKPPPGRPAAQCCR